MAYKFATNRTKNDIYFCYLWTMDISFRSLSLDYFGCSVSNK